MAIISITNPATKAGGKKARSLPHPIALMMIFAIMFYLVFLSSVSRSPDPPAAVIQEAATVRGASIIEETKSLQASTNHAPTVDSLDIEMAEFAYHEQKGERNPNAPVSEDFARYGANWPCFWGEMAVGDLETWKTKWGYYKDGWKYVCGLELITEPCVVYSLGSSGNMAFEKDLLKRGEVDQSDTCNSCSSNFIQQFSMCFSSAL
jgi:hypothetical protein